MAKPNQYKYKQEQFLADLRQDKEIRELRAGVLYKVVEEGEGDRCPNVRSIVTCHYKGSLTNGKVFDETFSSGCPAAFRVSDLIDGFQMALTNMHVGDHWIVYIPSEKGYGNRGAGRDIPGNSTLVFEIKLLSIA